MNKTYTINELSMMTGLTTRTLRNYINLDLLKGTKIEGMWQFTEEQIAEFISHPTVKPSIQAKNKAIIFDFLANDSKKSNQICTIVDLCKPRHEADQACALCVRIINATDAAQVRFSYEYHKDTGRIMLSGPQEFVTDVLNQLKRL